MSGSTDSSALSMAISNSVSKSFRTVEKALNTHFESSSSLLTSVSDELLECSDNFYLSASLIFFSTNTLLASARHLGTSSGILAASANALMSANKVNGKGSAKTQKTKNENGDSGSWFDTVKNAYKETKSFLDTARGIYKEAKGIKDAWQGKSRYKGEKSRGKRLLDWFLDRDSTKNSKDTSVADLAFKDSGVQKVFVVNWPDNLGVDISVDLGLDLPGKKKKKSKSSKRKTSKRRSDAPGPKQGKSKSKNSYKITQDKPSRKSKAAKTSISRNARKRPTAIDSAQKKTPASARKEKRVSALDKTFKGQSSLEKATQKPAATKSAKQIPAASEAIKKPQGIAKSGKAARSAAKGGLWSRFTNWAGDAVSKRFGKIVKGAKFVGKKIPGFSLVAGGIAAVNRAMEGDWVGALGEAASGVAGMVPGIGTAISTIIDGALIARDMMKKNDQQGSKGWGGSYRKPSGQAKSHSIDAKHELTPIQISDPSSQNSDYVKATLLRYNDLAPDLQTYFAAATGTGISINFNQSINVGAGADAQQVKTAVNEANTKAQHDWEGIVADLFRDQRRVEYGVTSGIA